MAYRKIELTEEQLKTMAYKYETGASLREVAQEYGMSVSAVRRKLIDQDIPLRPKGRPVGATHVIKLSLEDRQKIIAEYSAGATSTDLAAKYDVTKERICQICRAAGVIRTRKRPRAEEAQRPRGEQPDDT